VREDDATGVGTFPTHVLSLTLHIVSILEERGAWICGKPSRTVHCDGGSASYLGADKVEEKLPDIVVLQYPACNLDTTINRATL
jgi:hypothetical protein